MNKIYKVIWSATLGTWVAVSELVKGKKKSATVRAVAHGLGVLVIVSLSSVAMAKIEQSGTSRLDGIALGTSDMTLATSRGSHATSIGANTIAQGINSIALGGAATTIAIDFFADHLQTIGQHQVKVIKDPVEGNGQLTLRILDGGKPKEATFTMKHVDGKWVLDTSSTDHFYGETGQKSRVSSQHVSSLFAMLTTNATVAYGDHSIAQGNHAVAWGENSIVIGRDSTSHGKNEIAIGTNARTDGNASVAVGRNSSATGAGAVAVGSGSSALGNAALAFSGGAGGTELKDILSNDGKNSTNNGYRQIILDKTYAVLQEDGSYRLLAEGAHKDGKLSGKAKNTAHANFVSNFELNIDPASTADNIIITGGTFEVDGISKTLNADEATAIYQSLSMGTAIALGDNSTAFGYSALAAGAGSNALGAASIASGEFSIALGRSWSKGEYSFSAGYGAEALGSKSIALGKDTLAENDFSTALGSGGTGIVSITKATGAGALALGGNAVRGAQATADNAIAIGGQSSVSKNDGIALGVQSRTTAIGGVSIGPNSSAQIENSIALGTGSVANISAGRAGYDPKRNGNSQEDSSTWKSTHGAVSVGDGATITRQITSVSAGTKDTDAVNVAQLKALNESLINKGLIIGANVNVPVKHQLGKQLDIKADNLSNEEYSKDNLLTEVSQDNNGKTTVKIGMKKDVTFESVTIPHNGGLTVLDQNGLIFKNTLNETIGPSITLQGIDAGSKKIKNVLSGTENTDVVNVYQLSLLDKKVNRVLS